MDNSKGESRTLICPFCSETELLVVEGVYDYGPRHPGFNDLVESAGCLGCECGHPEMRRLPDGVYRCPACGSEVTPITAPASWKSPDHTEAYWCGWLEGRYGDPEHFTNNPRLAKWKDPSDRLEQFAVSLNYVAPCT